MAFTEPDVLLEVPQIQRIALSPVNPKKGCQGADLGVLHLKDDCLDLQGRPDFVRVFKAYKNPDRDWMIPSPIGEISITNGRQVRTRPGRMQFSHRSRWMA